jgi:hypothetical protein
VVSWKDVLERFEAGDVGAEALQALLDDPALPEAAAEDLRQALELGDELSALWKGRGPTREHVQALRDRLKELPDPTPPEEPSPSELLGHTEDGARQLLTEAVRACGGTEGTLWLQSIDGSKLIGTLNSTLDGCQNTALEGLSVPISASGVGDAFQTREPIRISRKDYQDPVATWTSGVDVTAMIAVPLTSEGEVRGVVSIVNPTAGGQFSAEDLKALVWKARLLGLVIQECFREETSKWMLPRRG